MSLFIAESANILMICGAGVVVGVPLGAYFIRRLDAETFRRICMSFDAWVVGFGLSRVFIDLNLIASPWAYSVMAVTILIDTYLLYLFFKVQRAIPARSETPSAPLTSGDRNELPDDNSSNMIDRRDPFGPLHTLLGYIIAIAAIAMLDYSIRL